MAISAHAYVRGNTLKFYGWLESIGAGNFPGRPGYLESAVTAMSET
jgi:hypothetical protein